MTTRFCLSIACALSLVLGAHSATAGKAAKRGPLPVAKDPLDLAKPTWLPGVEPRGRDQAQPAKGLRISGVYAAPQGDKHPQPAEAIALMNGSDEPIRLAGLRLEVVWPKRKKTKRATMALASKEIIEPGQELWLAADALAFAHQFGRPPDMAAVGAGGPVERLGDSWAALPDGRAVVRLYQPGRGQIDAVAYNLTSKPWTPHGEKHWVGPAVAPTQSSAVTGKRQIIRRDRSATGGLLAEFDGARDYDACSWHSGFGADPVHRCFMAGQSNFMPVIRRGKMEVVATSSPDNNFKGLVRRFESAKREILVSIYHFTSGDIADALTRAAKRGVSVTVYAEGSPVGGLPEHCLKLFRHLTAAGVQVMILRGDKKKKILKRFRYDHSKYAIIDREWLVVGSENYGYTGHPKNTRHGNRGWEIQIKHPGLVKDLLAVWHWDTMRANLDVEIGDERLQVPVSEAGAAVAGLRSRSHGSKRLGDYIQPAAPLRITAEMEAQLVLSPDNSLAEQGAVLGMISAAKTELLVLQNSMPTRWGRGRKKVASPLVDAVVAAARRGVKTRVLLDAVFYQLDPNKPDGNDDTVRYLNALAQAEGLDLQARLIDLETLGLAKIHAKGVIADAQQTFVGSQNWSENSFRANREVGVAITSTAVAGYYRRLFWRDWRYSPPSRHRLVTSVKLGKSRLKSGTIVGLVTRRNGVCSVRHRSQVGTVQCDVLGQRLLSAAQTYVHPNGPATVRGRVRKLHKAKSYWYLNFGEFWRQDFSVQIPVAVAEQMAAAGLRFDRIAGQAVEVSGDLTRYNGPCVRVGKVGDLKVLTLRKGVAPWP